VQVISQARSNQNIQVHQREQHLAEYFAAHPGTPQTLRIRGGDERVAIVRSARLYVCSHKTLLVNALRPVEPGYTASSITVHHSILQSSVLLVRR
jgi:hypothetical protein